MEVRVKRNLTIEVPEIRVPARILKKGETMFVAWVAFPGKERDPGTVGALVFGPTYTEWRFWSSHDPDTALIIRGEDVAEVLITQAEAEEWKERLEEGGFRVVIDDEADIPF